jgi:hypothetical protein
MEWTRSPASDRELKLDWDFRDIGPFREIQRPVLKHDASMIVYEVMQYKRVNTGQS